MTLETDNSAPAGRTGLLLRLLLPAAIIALLLPAAIYFDLQRSFRDVLAWIEGAGAAGPLVFFVLYVGACVLMLPGSILTLGAGAVFGVVNGLLLVSLSSTVGATAAFLVGRYLAREMVAKRVAGNETFGALDAAVAAEGWKIVGLARLSPLFPFNLLNYAMGLTQVSLSHYVLASWIGMMPGTAMYVYLGSLAGSLAELGANEGGSGRGPAQWVLYGIGLIATVGITVVITRIARGALRRRIGPPAGRKEAP